jgi:hypothetical protein
MNCASAAVCRSPLEDGADACARTAVAPKNSVVATTMVRTR